LGVGANMFSNIGDSLIEILKELKLMPLIPKKRQNVGLVPGPWAYF